MAVNIDERAQVTSIEDLKRFSEGELVELPAFGQSQPFFAKVRRPSMMKLAERGKIPNSLLTVAEELFSGKPTLKADKGNVLGDTFKVCEVIAEASLVSPSYAEIKEAGLELADDQLIFLFNYSQRGVAALRPFRPEQKAVKPAVHGEAVQPPAK